MFVISKLLPSHTHCGWTSATSAQASGFTRFTVKGTCKVKDIRSFAEAYWDDTFQCQYCRHMNSGLSRCVVRRVYYHKHVSIIYTFNFHQNYEWYDMYMYMHMNIYCRYIHFGIHLQLDVDRINKVWDKICNPNTVSIHVASSVWTQRWSWIRSVLSFFRALSWNSLWHQRLMPPVDASKTCNPPCNSWEQSLANWDNPCCCRQEAAL